jgi:hypothetical protein
MQLRASLQLRCTALACRCREILWAPAYASMKRVIGLPATTTRARRKKRGFSSEFAASAAGHIHVPGRHSSAAVSCFGVRGTRMEN